MCKNHTLPEYDFPYSFKRDCVFAIANLSPSHIISSIIVPEMKERPNTYKHCINISLEENAEIIITRKWVFSSHFETDFLILRQILGIYKERVPKFYYLRHLKIRLFYESHSVSLEEIAINYH